MNDQMSKVERFYQDVSDLLGVPNPYAYNPHTVGGTYRTRWNNRTPGNGRFEGFGLVRYYGESCVHVAISRPGSLNSTFDSTQAALDAIKQVVDENTTSQ